MTTSEKRKERLTGEKGGGRCGRCGRVSSLLWTPDRAFARSSQGRYEAGPGRSPGTSARSRSQRYVRVRRANAGTLRPSAMVRSKARSQRRRATAAAKICRGQGRSLRLRYLQARMEL